jgi:sulfate adenylyltransferase subunit 2
MNHLRALEDQSVYILREAHKHFDNLAMLWSMGKDFTVLTICHAREYQDD